MPFFKVVSRSPSSEDFEFEGPDIGSALALADKKQLLEAELWKNGEHTCDIRRDDEFSQLWFVAGASRKE